MRKARKGLPGYLICRKVIVESGVLVLGMLPLLAPFGIDSQGGGSDAWVQLNWDDFEFWG